MNVEIITEKRQMGEEEVAEYMSAVQVIQAYQEQKQAAEREPEIIMVPPPEADPFPALTQDQKMEILETLLETEELVFTQAQKEYASTDNIFVNFNRAAKRLDITPEKALMVYAMKHVDGILSWVNGHQLQREDVEGRIEDLRIYMAILYMMVKARKAGMTSQYPEGVVDVNL